MVNDKQKLTNIMVIENQERCDHKTYPKLSYVGIDHPAIDTLIADRTKTLALRYIHDGDHFINDFLSQCPSGRYRTVKYTTMCGMDSFLLNLIHVLNHALF